MAHTVATALQHFKQPTIINIIINQIDWDKLEEANLESILANSCYKQYLQNSSEHDLTDHSTNAFDFQPMLEHSEFNLEQLKQAQNSLSEPYSQVSQYNNDESSNHDAAPNNMKWSRW